MTYVTRSICLIFALFCANFDTASCECSSLDNLFFIRNKVSGYVLDTSDYRGVKIQPFNASNTYQQFKLHPASRPGLFNIYKDGDISEYMLTYTPIGDYSNFANLTMRLAEGLTIQQWFLNADGTIINAGFLNYGLTVEDSPWYAGNYVVVSDASNFGVNQTFELTNAHLPPPEL